VFHNAIKQLSSSRLVLLTTHDLTLLKYCDLILALDSGAVSFDGKLDEFIASGMLNKLQVTSSENITKTTASDSVDRNSVSPAVTPISENRRTEVLGKNLDKPAATSIPSSSAKRTDAPGKIASKLNHDIDKFGAMSATVYLEYAKACGLFMSCFALIASASAYTISVSSDVILAKWTDAKGSTDGHRTSFSVYAIMAGIVVVMNSARYLVYVLAGLRASETLHQNLLVSILRAPFSFFDRTPSGQIFSRFSGDMDTIDFSIPPGVVSAVDSILGVLSSIALISTFAPMLLVALVPLALTYIATQARYRRCSRELKRIDSGAKSPIFSQFREVLSGIESVRSYRMQRTLIDQHYEILDRSIRARLNWDAANRWLGIRIDIIGALIVSSAAFFVATFGSTFTGGLAGLILSYAMKTTNSLSFAIRSSTALENLFTSPERVVQYSSIPSEESIQMSTDTSPTGEVAPPSLSAEASSWWSFGGSSAPSKRGYVPIPGAEPSEADLEAGDSMALRSLVHSPIDSHDHLPPLASGQPILRVRSLRASYGEGDGAMEILHGIDLDLKAGALVGVCGRTGAGKSTLVLALARSIDASFRSPVASALELCGVNAASIPLETYRALVQVYPQDYYILSGTVRDAIDPFRRHSDAELRDLIAQFGAVTSVPSADGSIPVPSAAASSSATAASVSSTSSALALDLSTRISAGGQNLSAGQRQAVAFVRAALTEALVVVLDEFNSNMDLIASHRAFSILRYIGRCFALNTC
jgi:ABC-type multidrug transport system fused ATPase/permease subunit